MQVGLTMTFVFGRMTTKIILVFPPPNLNSCQGPSHQTTLPIFYKFNNTPGPPRHNHQLPIVYKNVHLNFFLIDAVIQFLRRKQNRYVFGYTLELRVWYILDGHLWSLIGFVVS